MDIFFKTRKIEAICNENAAAVKKLGADNAKKLQLRLSQLFAIKKLGDFHFDSPHPLKGNKLGKFSVALQDGLRIIFKAHNPIPTTSSGTTDWHNVIKIMITNIEDYH
jgi:plasmid maintenance system killer protein